METFQSRFFPDESFSRCLTTSTSETGVGAAGVTAAAAAMGGDVTSTPVFWDIY